MNKKLKEGQVVMYRGEKYEFIEYSPTSPTGIEQRVILKKDGIGVAVATSSFHKPVYEVLERELED